MSTFIWKPAPGAKCTTKTSVLKSQFGDGYEGRVGDGINNARRTWSVSFSKLVAEIELIESFLRQAAGVSSFDWTPPSGAAGKFVCDTWDRDIQTEHVQVISATFREVFEP